MKLLITGAGGFIAPHVGDAASAAGHQVVMTDIRDTSANYEFRKADLLSADELISISSDVDAICHLGGVGDVYLAAENPPLAAQANVVGTANVLEAARHNKLKKSYSHPRGRYTVRLNTNPSTSAIHAVQITRTTSPNWRPSRSPCRTTNCTAYR